MATGPPTFLCTDPCLSVFLGYCCVLLSAMMPFFPVGVNSALRARLN